MSLIIKNNKTLKDTAIIILKNIDGKKTIENNKDFSLIKIHNNLVGINVFNSSNYFESKEGAHTLSQKQREILKENDIFFEDDFPFFQIGEIIERKNHPKSEKLFILKVKTDKELQIVTNSLNSLVGEKVVIANIGASLPSGKIIKHSKVFGIESEGMLCGGSTLGREETKGVLIVEGLVGEEFIL